MLAWIVVAALAAAPMTQAYDNAEAARAGAELQAVVKAQGKVDLGALRSLDAAAARMDRCQRIMERITVLDGAKQERWAAIAARLPAGTLPPTLLRDILTAQASTPDGLREGVLRRDYAACMTPSLMTMPEPARTCAKLEQPIDDLKLAKEQRWLAYRGAMPDSFADKAAVNAYATTWRTRRERFEAIEAGSVEQARLAEMEAIRHRACSGTPPARPSGGYP